MANQGPGMRAHRGVYHGSVKDEQGSSHWYEFSAKFTDGKLVGIERITEDSPLYW